MFWVIKAVIMVALVFFEVVLRRLSYPKSFLPVLILAGMPVFWSHPESPERVIALGLVTFLWMLSRRFRNKIFRFTVIFNLILFTVFSVLFFNGIIGTGFHWDPGRTIMVDAGYTKRITSLREQSLYLPYKFRPVFFGYWSVILDNLGRTLNLLWFDSLFGTIGLTASIFLIPAILQRKNRPAVILILAAISSGVISRNPDSSVIFLLVSPALFSLAVDGLEYFSPVTYFPLAFLGLIYMFTA